MPAGDMSTLKVNFFYGADACYIGGSKFSLRAKAINFEESEMKEAIEYAHRMNKKIYVAANIFAKNDDIKNIYEYFEKLNEIKPDAVLVTDIGVLGIAKKILKGVDIHISTQANTTNYESVIFYRDLGVKRVVLARELTLDEIKFIKEEIADSIEIECFVHGSMCISYSGRCLLSSFFTNRSANSGECTHPCRWKYSIKEREFDLIEEERPNDIYTIEEDDKGTYILNSKDLCMVGHIDDLIEAGIDSFKIEGRMKSELYMATIARTYRKAIDDYFENKNTYKDNIPKYMEEIKKCTYREYTTGFYYGYDGMNSQIYDNSTYIEGAKFLGIVERVDGEYCYFTQKNKFSVGDEMCVMKKNLINENVKVIEMFDAETNEEIDSCPHSKQKLKVKFDKRINVGEVIRTV